MQRKFSFGRAAMAAALGGAVLTGCATAPKPLYDWEGYQPQVYEYFKGESKEAQIIALERDLEKIKAANNAAPPGYHAHLGLLYASVGKPDKMVEEFQTEKQLFPESAGYIDFLLKDKTPKTSQTPKTPEVKQ
ncbi:hypothetical protein PIN31009_03216 [Pandoraea iniqua]|uniref:Lipoprotein n=1 Tax=Pandoraea iniqua TaxID=2508288 RepID=A0A5E4WA63_9BURK|nr:DUF4810 domain-containing protein [Pandoraea iniqua]VVE21321.1 hypothetical protein PIN31115_03154 [Pandoraea iniqua]VVE23092.1 hypothetical protein PIN31009_03216 [Pandoraea iniqua]